MKKILSILILSVLLISLIAPMAVLAQKEKLKECCVIRQDMTWKKGSIYKVCNESGCIGSAQPCDSSPYCSLKKGDRIGAKGAVVCPVPSDADAVINRASEQWGMICIVSTITSVTNWVFYLMMVAVVIVFVIAGAMFMMAGGDTGKTKNAKGLMILAIIGLVIALLAKLIPSVVRLIVGV
ncbi:MAG: hypothetical protein PHU56_04570 [Candidatus Pacebacteria bacterium]|nr:hypothetical protein [Candidatus Paceibacterota bacterium]